MNTLSPPDGLLGRARQFLESGRVDAAQSLLAVVRARVGETSDVALLDAQLALKAHRSHREIEILDRAILADPAHPALRKRRADVRRRFGDHRGAAEDAAEAVTLTPNDAEAKAMLGEALLEMGHATEANACLAGAVASAPHHARLRQRCADALVRTGHPELARDVIADGIALGPPDVGLFNAAIQLCKADDNLAGVLDFADQARRSGVADVDTFAAIGLACLAQGRTKEAGAAFQEALKLRPDDSSIRHLAASCGVIEGRDRTPIRYLTRNAGTDGAVHRNTAVHAAVAGIVFDHPNNSLELPVGPILDLGCGIGEMAHALGGLRCASLTGIDVSSSRLAKARASGLYAVLREIEIQTYLDTCQQTWPLIIAATCLRNFGDLGALMGKIRMRLARDGWLICFFETMPFGTWKLQETGRFAHNLDYLYDCICKSSMRVLQRRSIGPEASGSPLPNGVLLTIGHSAR